MEIAFRLLLGVVGLWSVIVFILILHEYGHVWAMNKVGIKPNLIVIGSVKLFEFKVDDVIHRFGLFPLVGYVTSPDYLKASVDKRAIVSAGGPIMSVIIGLILIAFGTVADSHLAVICGKSSIFLAVTNLLPLPPMDGWPILEWLLHRRGIVVRESTKKSLLAVGWGAIALIILFAH